MTDDLMDEPEYDEGPDSICHECNGETIGESCGFCGNDLCPACFESGGGFCSAKHTQQQVDDYEDIVNPPANEGEALERKRRRLARDELVHMGILPRL